MKIIIPAAGYATRLGELTKNKPKHLLEVGGVPLINHLIKGIKNLPIDEVFLVTNHKFYEQFVSWRTSLRTKLKIHILNDNTFSNDDRLGTVGDIHFTIEESSIDDDILVIAGDNLYWEKGKNYYLNSLYNAFYKLKREAGIIGLFNVKSLEIAKHMNQMTFANDFVPSPSQMSRILAMREKDPHPTTTLIAVLIASRARC